MTTPAAYVQGNNSRALLIYDEVRGDLVDLRFYCPDCWERDEGRDAEGNDALPLPGYSFSPDYDTCCADCGEPIHIARLPDNGRHCFGNPTKADCVGKGYCRRDMACND